MAYKTAYHYVLFDWDGCIAQSLKIWISAYKKVFQQFGKQIEVKDILETVLGDWNGPLKLGVHDIKAYNTAVLKEVNQHLPKVDLYPHVKETILALRDHGVLMAIVTNSKRDSVLPALAYHGIIEYIDLFLGEEDVSHYKTHPEIIHKALYLLEAQPHEALIIGDSDKDIVAGKRAGIATALYYPPYNRAYHDLKELKKCHPDYIIEDFRVLTPIVLGIDNTLNLDFP